MDAVFLKLLNMSIAAGWLILAVVVLRVLLKKAPKAIRCILWAFAGIRLICPFSFESVLSLIPSAETVSPNILYSEAPTIHTGIGVLNQAVNPVLSESLAPEVGARVNPLQMITSVASIIWIIGVAALLLYAVISYLRLRRRVYAAMCLRDHLWLCDNVTSPFILGFFKPRIYLPSNLYEQQIAHVAAHEQAHIKRHDHWWKPIGFILLAVYWFNPLVWLAYILLCRDIELACDERVVKELGIEDKKAYSAALLSCSVPHRMIAACPLAFGEVGVKERIKNVLNYKKPAFWIVCVALVSCAAVAGCFLTNPKDSKLYAPDPFCHTYRVERIAYDAPQYSFTYTPDTAPGYCLTSDYAVMAKEGADDWLSLGSMTSTKLTKDNFDLNFDNNGAGGWQDDLTASALRRDNEKAWKMVTSDTSDAVFYYLLLQKNGDVYMTYGYYGTEGETDPESTASSIRWLFKLKVEEAAETGAYDIVVGDAYVSSECLYMNPLSSYSGAGGDSGCRYMITEDAFTIMNRLGGSIQSISSIEWGWQEFPYTDDEWRDLYAPTGFDTQGISGIYKEMLYQPLSAQYSLFRMDGQLWLTEMHENNKMGKYLWSIYTLVPESSMGSAQWEYQPFVSSQFPAFPLRFDLPYTEISAACTNGLLIGFDDHDGNEYPQGNSLTVPAGSALYWAPGDKNGGAAMDTEIHFTVHNGDRMTYAGTIYITGEPAPSGGIYTATVVGGGLHMLQAEDTLGAMITAADESPAATTGGIDDSSLHVIISEAAQNKTALDLAISAAILDHNKGAHSGGDFACESHVILDTQTTSGTPKAGESKGATKITVYAMVLYQEYRYSGVGFTETGGSHIPTALTFEAAENDAYTLIEYWQPRDGSYYAPDIKAKFPGNIYADAIDTQKYILAQKQACYAQAVEYGKIDTRHIIEQLLETIMSSPAASSNPGDYIDAHYIEYRELTYYGDYTLEYVFSEFLQGNQTGLKGHIMRIVMDDLIGSEALHLETATGQEYFDYWKAHTQRLAEDNGLDYMKESAPKSWLLMQMLNG